MPPTALSGCLRLPLTVPVRPSILGMSASSATQRTEFAKSKIFPQVELMTIQIDVQALERRIDELIQLCDDLIAENKALRELQANMISERAALVEKSELARDRVEAMISRLKAMEVHS